MSREEVTTGRHYKCPKCRGVDLDCEKCNGKGYLTKRKMKHG